MIVSVLKITLIEIMQILFNHIWVGIQVRLRLYVVSPVMKWDLSFYPEFVFLLLFFPSMPDFFFIFSPTRFR